MSIWWAIVSVVVLGVIGISLLVIYTALVINIFHGD